MLAKMIDKIVSLKQTQTFEIGGRVYADKELFGVNPAVDRPAELEVNGLDSVCKLVRKELDKIGVSVFVHVSAHDRVNVMTTYLGDFSRNRLYRAVADVPGMRGGWKTHEEAMIQLRSLFIPTEGSAYLLDLLSRISDTSAVTSVDNGVTQTVEMRQGIDLKSMVAVKPRVALQPFRTFLEVEQPESEFLLRVDKEKGIGLFEADGGVWKLEAKNNIAKYFERELNDLIQAGSVVVMV